jgi:hypothetical protein
MLRAALAAACLAILTPGCSKAAPPAPRFNLQVVVMDCYTHSDSQVSIDERPLALYPPSRREDSVGVCYDGPVGLGAEVQIGIRSRGQNRRIAVRPNAQSRYLLINPDNSPYAELRHDAPLLD